MVAGGGGVKGGDREGEREREERRAGGEGGIRQRATEGGMKERRE